MVAQRRRERGWKALSGGFFGLFATAAVLALSACGGGAGTSGMSGITAPTASAKTGAAMITLTDAPGDFLSYMVDVVSIKLTRADGTVIETLPMTTQVDFAQLVNLSEIISAKQIPEGSYTAASMTLDYAGATIVIDNGGGTGGITVPAGNLINGTGSSNAPLVAPNTQVTLSLQMPLNQPLVITDGTVANFALDFNLAASNAVAPSTISTATPASAVTVTVNPVLTASLIPDATKQIQVRGPLVSVGTSSYVINLRPFYDNQDSGDQVTVIVTPTASYTINGTAYAGAAGLAALAALPAGTLTSAAGSYNVASMTFTAVSVYAGTSVAGAGLDSIVGTVVARSGNVLTVSNGQIHHADDDVAEYGGSVAATIAATTLVTEDGQTGTFGAQDISIGQHVQLFGKLGTDGSGNRTLDASQGSARLMLTSLNGQVVSTAAGVLTVALQSLDGRQPTAFNFAGTGKTQDATAANYVVSIPSSLALPALSAGMPISLQGFASGFGSGPPYFTAVGLADYANTGARVAIEFPEPGVAAPFVAPLSAANVVMTQATLQGATAGAIFIGFEKIDPATLTTGLSFVADTSTTTAVYAILHKSSETVNSYGSFSDLIAALAGNLNGTVVMRGLAAQGSFDATTGVLTTNTLLVLLGD